MKQITKFDNLNIQGIHFIKDLEDKSTLQLKFVFEGPGGELLQVMTKFSDSEALQYIRLQSACLAIHKFTGDKATQVVEE